MKRQITVLILLFLVEVQFVAAQEKPSDFTIVFGSCNDQKRSNELWEAILANKPDLWIWGGDNIYSDTDNPNKMKSAYNVKKKTGGDLYF